MFRGRPERVLARIRQIQPELGLRGGLEAIIDDGMQFIPYLLRGPDNVRQRQVDRNKVLYPFDEESGCYRTADGVPITKLYIANLSRYSEEVELFNYFSKYGAVDNVLLIRKTMEKHGAMYGFVTFESPQVAARLLKDTSTEIVLRKRRIYIYPADSCHQPPVPGGTTIKENAEPENDEDDVKQDVELCPIMSLNDDCLRIIFDLFRLDERKEIGQVCKRWRYLNNLYWRSVKSLDFSKPPLCNIPKNKLGTEFYLKHCTNLNSLVLEHDKTPSSSDLIVYVAKHCKNLESLTLKSISIQKRCIAFLAYSCRNLKSISIDDCPYLQDHELIALINKNPHLESLTIRRFKNSTAGWLCSIQPPLKSLTLERNSFSSQNFCAGIKSVASTLKSLTLSSCLTLKQTDLEFLTKTIPDLESLTLKGGITSLYVDSLVRIADLKNLKYLDLGCSLGVTDHFLSTLADNCVNLKHLKLRGDDGNRHSQLGSGISVIARFKELTCLKMSKISAVNDEFLILMSKKLSNLKSLEVTGNTSITDRGCKHIIQNCHHLERLNVRGCPQITDNTILSAIELFIDLERTKLHIMAAGTGVTDEDWFTDPGVNRLLNIDLTSGSNSVYGSDRGSNGSWEAEIDGVNFIQDIFYNEDDDFEDLDFDDDDDDSDDDYDEFNIGDTDSDNEIDFGF